MRTLHLPVCAATLTLAPADATRGQTIANPLTENLAAENPVMEIVTFHLVPGTADADFLAAAKGTRAAVAAQPGFVRRHLMQVDDLWTDMIVWQNLALAHAAAKAVMADPAFAPFAALIDMTSLAMRHVPVLWQMGD